MVKKTDKRDYSAILKSAQDQITSNQSQKNQTKDERFWQLTRDKDMNGFAIIRFLPDKNPAGGPFKAVYKHAITIDKKLFIDKCPTTIGEQCPICDWNKDQPSDWVKKESKSYRKKSYISNILVVSDPHCKENEGKVFLFEFGYQIFTKLKDKLFPAYAEEEALIYFHPEEGANFKVKIKKDGEFASWNGSEFDAPSDITKKFNFEEIEKNLYDLESVIDKTTYKTYDDLDQKFKRYLKGVGLNGNVSESPDVETKSRKLDAEQYNTKKSEAMKKAVVAIEDDESVDNSEFDDYFASIEKK